MLKLGLFYTKKRLLQWPCSIHSIAIIIRQIVCSSSLHIPGSIDEAHFLSPSRFKKQGLIFSLQGKWSFLGPERTFGVGHWNDWANLSTLCALIKKGLILAVIEPLLSLASTFGFRRHWEFFFFFTTRLRRHWRFDTYTRTPTNHHQGMNRNQVHAQNILRRK